MSTTATKAYPFYLVNRCDTHVKEVEAVRHTPKTVWVRQAACFSKKMIVSRHPIRSNYDNYFPTRAEAVAFLRNRLESDLRRAQKRLTKAESELFSFLEQEERLEDTQ